jgi:ferric-dicitrate binding protein FerR (iron transport regulator)
MSTTAATATPEAAQLARRRLHARRKRRNVVALTLALAAMAFGIFWLVCDVVLIGGSLMP